MATTSFTEAVRQELARLPLEAERHLHAELAAVIRVGGQLRVHGGDPPTTSIEVTTSSGSVARRTFILVQHHYGIRAELQVRAPGGIQRHSSYRVGLGAGAERVGRDLGVLDPNGRIIDGLPPGLRGRRSVAYLRGAMLAGGSISAPDRSPHLEIPLATSVMAEALAGLLRQVVGSGAALGGDDRPRVVLKSGAAIGELLGKVGATNAFLRFDDRRLRRQLRGDANRLANADAANLRRIVAAAAAQVHTVEAVIAEVGWESLDDDLKAIALARLANPDASLTELGQLIDPVVGKSAVHRRLRRLEQLAQQHLR